LALVEAPRTAYGTYASRGPRRKNKKRPSGEPDAGDNSGFAGHPAFDQLPDPAEKPDLAVKGGHAVAIGFHGPGEVVDAVRQGGEAVGAAVLDVALCEGGACGCRLVARGEAGPFGFGFAFAPFGGGKQPVEASGVGGAIACRAADAEERGFSMWLDRQVKPPCRGGGTMSVRAAWFPGGPGVCKRGVGATPGPGKPLL